MRYNPKNKSDQNKKPFIPFALPEISEDEINEVVDTLRSGWLTTGPKTKIFEEKFAEYIGCKHALAVSSGTAGLHLSLEASGITQGDLVITTPYTFTATAEVIRYLGAEPLFIDISHETFNIDVNLIKKKLVNGTVCISDGNQSYKTIECDRVKAIMPVHFGGQACDMDEIKLISKDYNLKIIEDAAHALPCTYNGHKIGTIGDSTVFSFYVTKPLATGEGGMITTDSDNIAKRIKIMRLHGINRDVWDRYVSNVPNWYYEVVAPGYKYNISDIMSSIGIHQLNKVDLYQKRRMKIAKYYNYEFKDLPVKVPFVSESIEAHSWHLYVLQLEIEKLSINRNEFIKKMAMAGIGTSVHFIPLHIQPYWKERYRFKPEEFPVSYDCFNRSVSLPIYSKMSDADVERVANTVKKIIMENARDV